MVERLKEISNKDQGKYKKDEVIRIVRKNKTYESLNLDTRLEKV